MKFLFKRTILWYFGERQNRTDVLGDVILAELPQSPESWIQKLKKKKMPGNLLHTLFGFAVGDVPFKKGDSVR